MYDFELNKMMENFDFESFMNPPESEDRLLGGWLIITDNQYVMGYNDFDGMGYHGDSIRRALCEIFDEGRYSQFGSPSFVNKNFIIGTMMSGQDNMYILFDLNQLRSITPNQYKLFEEFKNKYNDIIKRKSIILGNNTVFYENNGTEVVSKDLDLVSYVLCQKIDENKKLPKDVEIIGETLEKKSSKEGIREKQSFQFTPYDYLMSEPTAIRGAAVITDKQTIFYGSLKEFDFRTPYGICKEIEKTIHFHPVVDILENHSYLYLSEDKAVFNLPSNGKISLTQMNTIMNYMMEIVQYNREVTEDKKITIQVKPWHGSYKDSFSVNDFMNLFRVMEQNLVPEVEEEEIIVEKNSFEKTLK